MHFVKTLVELIIPNFQLLENKSQKINFNHPLYQTVFEKKVTNFQYPNVKESFSLSGITNILQYEDNSVSWVRLRIN